MVTNTKPENLYCYLKNHYNPQWRKQCKNTMGKYPSIYNVVLQFAFGFGMDSKPYALHIGQVIEKEKPTLNKVFEKIPLSKVIGCTKGSFKESNLLGIFPSPCSVYPNGYTQKDFIEDVSNAYKRAKLNHKKNSNLFPEKIHIWELGEDPRFTNEESEVDFWCSFYKKKGVQMPVN